jgi:hypothetical protein
MQVPLSFFQQWAPAVRKHANSLGKKNFGIFGEFYCTRERAATMTGRGMEKQVDAHGRIIRRSFIGTDEQETMDGGIHYPFYFWMMKTVRDQQGDVAGLLHLYNADKADYDFWNPNEKWQWEYR